MIPYIGPEMVEVLMAKYESSDIASPSCADDRVVDSDFQGDQIGIDVTATKESMTERKTQANKFLQDIWPLLFSFLLLATLLFVVSAIIFLALRLPSFLQDYEVLRQWAK